MKPRLITVIIFALMALLVIVMPIAFGDSEEPPKHGTAVTTATQVNER